MRLAVLMVAALAGPAHADEATNRARAHFEIGNGMYRLGDFRGALREFAAGYELTRKPGFLINLGQTYRKLRDLPRARDMYRQYLASTAPDDPARPAVKQVLGDIEEEMKTLEPSPSPAPPMVSAASPVEVREAPMPPPKRGNRGMQIAGIVLGFLGVGAIAGGTAATVAANGLAQQINDLDRSGGPFDPAKDDRYHLDRTVAGTMFGLGAAMAVGGVILIAVGSR